MEDESEPQDEPQTFDLDKWIAQKEDREHAIRVLMPESKEQAELRRPFISKVRGPLTPAQLIVRAEYHFERLLARAEKRPLREDAHDVVMKLVDLQQSHNGWRADKIVEAHTGTPKPQVRKSWMDVILGKK